MVNNEIFEIENEEEIEEVEVLGKCPICGKVCTKENDNEFTHVYFSETEDYEYVCEDCKKNSWFCDFCAECYPCIRPSNEFVSLWVSEDETVWICKDIADSSYEQCSKCGWYCYEGVLSEDGLCPDCEYDRIEEERI